MSPSAASAPNPQCRIEAILNTQNLRLFGGRMWDANFRSFQISNSEHFRSFQILNVGCKFWASQIYEIERLQKLWNARFLTVGVAVLSLAGPAFGGTVPGALITNRRSGWFILGVILGVILRYRACALIGVYMPWFLGTKITGLQIWLRSQLCNPDTIL
ncbi:hypothetical protein SS50377_26239 [Spironucleus salmonicida]|uniref:Uncharacterized protein n=1 Tax=Spironucleus salmonicida TaxID=348837 RepID=A0A9P8LQ51_9EUKA|nr:hypothetical protein SS50377_26239 [Spironucleus salmonicida]